MKANFQTSLSALLITLFVVFSAQFAKAQITLNPTVGTFEVCGAPAHVTVDIANTATGGSMTFSSLSYVLPKGLEVTSAATVTGSATTTIAFSPTLNADGQQVFSLSLPPIPDNGNITITFDAQAVCDVECPALSTTCTSISGFPAIEYDLQFTHSGTPLVQWTNDSDCDGFNSCSFPFNSSPYPDLVLSAPVNNANLFSDKFDVFTVEYPMFNGALADVQDFELISAHGTGLEMLSASVLVEEYNQTPLVSSPVSYTHLRAHETS